MFEKESLEPTGKVLQFQKVPERGCTRGTGGNCFIGPEATRGDLLRTINDQLGDLHEYAEATGRVLDIAEVSVDTKRTKSGRISVRVSADLVDVPDL